MPTPSTLAFGRFARKLVNDSLSVQISGKMLIASSSAIVGPMNSQATARSDRPRMRVASAGGVATAARATRVEVLDIGGVWWVSPCPRTGGGTLAAVCYFSFPSSLKTFFQSPTSASSASLAVPLSATT